MSRSLPLVRLSVLLPLVEGLRRCGIDPESVLESVGLTEEGVRSDHAAVHVMVIHQFVENAAVAANDKTFAASIGLRIDTSGWPVLERALSEARSLGDFLNIYVSTANQLATSVQAYVEVRGDTAIFGEHRVFKPTIEPAQNDGFMAALAFSILRRVLGQPFDPSRITVVVCRPDALPEELSGCTLLAGDRMGFRLRFPSAWLALAVGETPDTEPSPRLSDEYSENFLGSFRKLLRQRIGSGRVSGEDAAILVAMNRSRLARRLASLDTDISSEIRRAELAFAQEQLSGSRRTIGDIAAALGYTDAANFARAFRKQTGTTPSEYRRKAARSAHRSIPGETDQTSNSSTDR